MDNLKYILEERDRFAVVGVMTPVMCNTGYKVVPGLWREFVKSKQHEVVYGRYGICSRIYDNITNYTIADDFDADVTGIPEGCVAFNIEAATYAVFKFEGKIPDGLQKLDQQIWMDWDKILPDYKMKGSLYFEDYENDSKASIWIPVCKISD